MKSTTRQFFLIASFSLVATGCGSPVRYETALQSPPVASDTSNRSAPNEMQPAPNAASANVSPDEKVEVKGVEPPNEETGSENAENPFAVPEDMSAPPAEIRSIDKAICKLKHAGKSYELAYAACYVVKELDGPTKCVIFSDSPIDVDMLKRELLEEGKPVYRWDLSKKATNMLGFLVREYGVSIDANIGKLSLGIASEKLESTICYSQGKIAGKIVTTAPIEVGDGSTIEIVAQLNQPVVQVNWPKRGSP